MADDERIEPGYLGERFTCPHCDHRTGHDWRGAQPMPRHLESIDMGTCQSCGHHTIWVGSETVKSNYVLPRLDGDVRRIYPAGKTGPRPHPSMPADVVSDFEEARTIAKESPRGACALLRLALQRLCVHLGWEGRPDDMNSAIQHLVDQRGMRVHLQQALDVVRVTGGEAVHPGTMDDIDDPATVEALMRMLNRVVEDLIASPAEIASLYDSLPQPKLDGIDQRQAHADAARADEKH